jgi:hypothetical protein
MEYALEPQQQTAGLRAQSSDDISVAIDESGHWNRVRQLRFRFPHDGMATIVVNIHHCQNCCRLREIERNVEAVTDMDLKPM